MDIKNPKDYIARRNLIWDAIISENCIIGLGKN